MKVWIEKNKYTIDADVASLWSDIGCDRPHNHDEIVEYCCEDVYESADQDNFTSGDVIIAFRRWIEEQSENQP